MKRFYLPLFFTVFSIGIFVKMSQNQFNESFSLRKETHSKKKKKGSKLQMIEKMYEQEIAKTRDPLTGTVPRERLLTAIKYADQLKASGAKVAISGVTWAERGPNNVGGRTRAILVDANDATKKTVFAAGVGGGIWKTTDITVASPVWVAVNDMMGHLAVTCLAQSTTLR